MAKKAKKDPRVKAAFDEVHENVPKSVKKTGKTGKAKQAMMTAIALSKARAAGADIPEPPSMQRGGVVPSTGVYQVHRGEHIIPAPRNASLGMTVRGGSKDAMPKVESLPYGRRGQEGPGLTPGTYDRMAINPFEEEGFSHLKPHESQI